ncbi:MAG: CBS domain-containing protein [Candidatus Omnitrophica bacterium]|nr:CBS domain-containing protein [Candidatus Omnitrophota bacterium]MDD5080394.1 CBS domain-containing protein [Candidatus Omnitrophota bacterium]MDD5440720.1 CBS domain-containing protein [Candidatus Omnitrophota bacterium]
MPKLEKIFIKDVMVKDPHTINVNEPFSKVWDLFKEYKIRHLPVIDDNRLLMGIVTQRDLYKTISPRKTMEGNFVYDKSELDRYILKYVMCTDMLTLKPDDFLGTAIHIMVNRKYGCIPVVHTDKKLAGIITQIDVLRALSEYYV